MKFHGIFSHWNCLFFKVEIIWKSHRKNAKFRPEIVHNRIRKWSYSNLKTMWFPSENSLESMYANSYPKTSLFLSEFHFSIPWNLTILYSYYIFDNIYSHVRLLPKFGFIPTRKMHFSDLGILNFFSCVLERNI